MMELLLLFVENQGQVLDTEGLHRTVWKDVVVSDGTIRKTISNLKNYFTINGHTYLDIQAVRSQGYKLSEDVAISYAVRRSDYLHDIFRKYLPYGVTVVSLILLAFFSFRWYHESGKVAKIPLGDAAFALSPELTEGGNKMIFCGTIDQSSYADIILFDFVSGESDNIVSSPYVDVHPTISADGLFLAYNESYSNKPNQIHSLNLKTGDKSHLTNIDYTAPLKSLDWSPDKQNLAIASSTLDNPTFRIGIFNIRDSTYQTVTKPRHTIYGDINPKYSPTGDHIAFIRTRHRSRNFDFLGGVGDIYVLDLKASTLQKVTNSDKEITGLDWSEDSKKIIYSVMNEGSHFEIRNLDLVSLEEQILHTSRHVIRNVSVNNKIVFEQREISYQFIEMDLMDSTPIDFRFINQGNGKYWYPSYANTSNDVAYISTASGYPELYIRKVITNKTNRITSFKGAHIGRAVWSKNDKHIAVTVNRNGNSDIYLVNTEEERVRPLLNSSFNEIAPQWSEDGKILYFSSNYEGKDQIWSIDISNDHSTPELWLDLDCYYFVRRGDHLFHSKFTKGQINRMDLSTKTNEVLISNMKQKDTQNWTIRNENLYFIRYDEVNYRVLMKKNLLTGSETTIASEEKNMDHFFRSLSNYEPGISVTFDERTIIGMTYGGKSPELMVIEDY